MKNNNFRSLLVAACEKKSVLMFDPLTRNPFKIMENAHSDCVNCVKWVLFYFIY